MCGIVGFINSDIQNKHGEVCRAVFEQLLWHDTQRGPDGTGVLIANGSSRGLETSMHKSAMWAPDFLGTHTYRKVIASRLEWARVALGHNRATTRGSVKNDNAHPFVHKHITLVHNGYLAQPDKYVPREWQHEVDSYAMAYNIAEKGEVEGLQAAPFQGVLVWWNDEDKTLNMARNEHRTLYCVPIKGKDTLFYASEWRMLDWILERNGLEPETKYKLLTPNMHFKFDPAKPKEWVRSPFTKPSNQNSTTTAGAGAQAAAACGLETVAQGTGQSQTASTSGSKEGEDSNLSVFPKRPDQVTDAELARIEKQFAKLSAKQRNKLGIPDNRNKLRKLCAKISNTGLDSYFGQRFVVYPDAFAPYKNQRKNGVVLGCKRDSDIRVEIPNSAPEDFDKLKNDKWCFATVVNAKKGKDGKWALVGALVPLELYKEELEEETEELMLPGPTGPIPLGKFQAMTQTGCGNCSGWINPSHAKDMMWFAGEPICHICATDEQICMQLGLDRKRAIH
jgi:predicted glutamine amidotransferase